MIRSHELRLGNFIDRNGLMEVKLIGMERIRIYDHVNKLHIATSFRPDQFSGIPLTEEWLLKFGFQKLHHFGNYEYTKLMNDPVEGKDKSALSIEVINRREDNAFLIRLVLEPSEYQESSVNYHNQHHVKYVHQLQNLFYALTGEELNY